MLVKDKFPYQRFILPNGLTVLLYPIEKVYSIFAVLDVRVGAVYEKQEERGISHFAEHVVFLGTKKYPSSLKISQREENIGAKLDGLTDKLVTQYWMKLPSLNMEKGLNLLHQIVFEPLLNEKDIFKEREVVLSEFNDFWHDPNRKFGHETWRKRFKQEEHPYSYRSLGIPSTIQQLDKELVVSWRNKYYHPKNMILSIAGNLESNDAIRKIIAKTFGKEPAGTKAEELKFDSHDYSNFSLYYQEEPRPQIKFILTFPAFGWRQVPRRSRLAMRLLHHVFGGGPASRLFQRLREKERFVYRVGSDFGFYPWMGDFEIWGSVPIEKLVLAMKAIREEIDRLVKEGVDEKEVKQTKSFLSASTLMGFDNPESIAYYFASQEFNQEGIWLPERYIEEVEKITKDEVNDLAKKIFDYSRINISLLGKVAPETIKQVEKVFTENN